jgi:hypothetical protein
LRGPVDPSGIESSFKNEQTEQTKQTVQIVHPNPNQSADIAPLIDNKWRDSR